MKVEGDYVYMNQDGTIRELSPRERDYLATDFAPFDGGRPYIKSVYHSRDGWDSLSGFMPRKLVPHGTPILPVHPNYDVLKADIIHDHLAPNRAAGDTIVEGEMIVQGKARKTISCTPNPNLSNAARFEIIKRVWLEEQAKRERLALSGE
jgi:hypothetical protein